MEIAFIALVALWGLSRSGFSSRYVYPVWVKNPADKLTEGFIGQNGSINQPTYGKMKVGFEAPKAELCYSSPTTKDGMRKYQVYKIAATEPRVILKVPAGYVGAGTEYNMPNWITQNSGEGYYVMIKTLKVGRGGRVVTPIDRNRFPNREREGLEGPFRNRKTSLVYYYDKKAGKYYDRGKDMFVENPPGNRKDVEESHCGGKHPGNRRIKVRRRK